MAQHGSSTVTVSFPVYSSEDSGAVTVHKTHNSQAMTGSGRFSGDFSAGVTEVTFPASNPSNYTAQCTVRVVVRGGGSWPRHTAVCRKRVSFVIAGR